MRDSHGRGRCRYRRKTGSLRAKRLSWVLLTALADIRVRGSTGDVRLRRLPRVDPELAEYLAEIHTDTSVLYP